MEEMGTWLSILDYAKFKNSSISTVRRHIKSKKVNSKLESGKYFIFVDEKYQVKTLSLEGAEISLENKVLKIKLRKLEEENNDLKMLVNLYEGANKSPINVSSNQAMM